MTWIGDGVSGDSWGLGPFIRLIAVGGGQNLQVIKVDIGEGGGIFG